MKIQLLCFSLMGIFLAGCASARYKGWEYVRIEKEIPSPACEYKIQEACSYAGALCYNWYKRRATKFGANTVVLTDVSKDRVSAGSAVVINSVGSANTKSAIVMTALADYYFCPQQKTLLT